MKLNKIQINTLTLPNYLKALSPLSQGFLSQMIKSEEELVDIINDDEVVVEEKNILKVAEFLLECQRNKSKIMICGDYDCDGIISTTLMMRLLQKLNLEAGYYIPNRLTEGYGTKVETIQLAYDKGYSVCIMVDNGVMNIDALNRCQELRMKSLVIDHHMIQDQVPCDLLYHPSESSKEFQTVCSSGQVLALFELMNLSDIYMEVLGGIATIADMMDLHGYNRFVVKRAIRHLNTYTFEPISKLLKSRVDLWDEGVIAFQIVPVFNAIGRLADKGNINQVVKYLLSTNSLGISHFSNQLLEINQMRKNMTTNHTLQAIAQLNDDQFHMIVNDNFHEGIVGIVAGQLVSKTNKPVMVLTAKGDVLKGSVRSNGMDVFSFLKQFEEDYFLSFGGHAQACALSILKVDFQHFYEKVQRSIKTIDIQEPVKDVLLFEKDAYTLEYYDDLSLYQPFGQGFKLPEIYIESIIIAVSPLGQSGYKLTILNVGEIKEILYFKKDVIFDGSNLNCGFVGNLTKSYRNELQLIASSIVIL